MRPRDGPRIVTAVLYVVFWILHPFVTLGLVAVVTGGTAILSTGFLVFILGMLVFKGGPILLWGVETPHDASLHTGSVTFAVTVFGMMDPGMVPYVAWTVPLVGVTVWWFRSHTPIGVLMGFVIGVTSGMLV